MPDLSEIKPLLKESAVIVALAAVLGLCVNLFHPKGFSLVSRESLREGRIVRVNSDEAKIKYDSAAALFIDTRSEEEYDAERIAGALSLPSHPLSTLDARLKREMPHLLQPRELVLYCDEACDSALALARRLLAAGYGRHLYVMDRGIDEWRERGFPVQRREKGGNAL